MIVAPVHPVVRETERRIKAMRESRRKAAAGGCNRDALKEAFPDQFGERPVLNKKGKPTGKTEWFVNVKIREQEGGKLTRDGHKLREMTMPWARAEAERRAGNPKPDVVPLRSPEGARFAPVEVADDWAARDGWGHRMSVGGSPVEYGPEGMLFRLVVGEWRPTGRWCLGTPATQSRRPPGGRRDGSMKTIGIYRAPDRTPWRYIDREWVCVG